MTSNAVILQPAFILQHRPYRETSLLLDMLTRDHGIVGMLAKGARKPKSRTLGLLLPFNALNVSYTGRSELKTLTHVELQIMQTTLSGLALYCGFYVNELLYRFCHKHDPQPDLYAAYVACLQTLQPFSLGLNSMPTNPHLLGLEATLRLFELTLLQAIGLAPSLQRERHTDRLIEPARRYGVEAETGFFEEPAGLVSGKTLQALHRRRLEDAESVHEAKRLLRYLIDFHLQGHPIKSRSVLSNVYRQLYG